MGTADQASGMRVVRPTIKVLKMLPRDTFDDTAVLDVIARKDFERLNLNGVQHSMLDDARRRFASGLPDRHTAASRDQKQPVFEVRDRTGAGWRGAVILDSNGDPWLVWAERHDQFHKRVSKIDLDELMPTPAEYKLRDREEAASEKRDWERTVLQRFIDAIRQSLETGAPATASISGATPASATVVEVAVDHNEPSDDITEAHDGLSMLTISVRIGGGEWSAIESALTRVCLPFLEPDPARIETVYSKDNTLVVYLDITHAQLIQLLADPPLYEASEPIAVKEPDRLHYVGIDYLLDGYVHGIPLRGVCGDWFVASRTETCNLPICERCEAEQPAAQVVLDLLRSKQ